MKTACMPVLLLTALLAGCATGAPSADPVATFVVVRHAEKASDTGRDPDLSAAGLERAQALARRFDGIDLVAAYATDYRRTRQTVQPTAATHGLVTVIYDASLPAGEFASQLRAAHRSGTVLVAGHSNTVPGIVAALCGCEAAPMPETEYDRLSTVRIERDGRARLTVSRHGAPAPDAVP